MTEVPKIVPGTIPGIAYDRLQAAALSQSLSGQGHPDAGLLTAFAEQAISAFERDSLLDHLARCGECRDVVALALPPAEIGNIATLPEVVRENVVPEDVVREEAVPENEIVVAQNRTGQSGRRWLSSFTFATPTFRWAAMAAGIAVVASVLLVRPGKLNQSQGNLDSAKRPVATATQAASDGQPAPSSPKLQAELQTSKKSDSPSAILMAENTIAPEARDLDRAVAVKDRALSKSAASPARNEARDETPSIEKAKPASPSNEAEIAEVAAASRRQKVEPSSNNSPATMKTDALNTLSSAEAKSASAGDMSRTDGSQTHPATFAVSGGILRRSLDNGQNWQNVLHADHSLLCYASKGRDIWTGGEAGVLFHSADNGVTWIRVQASVGPQMLTSEITDIALSRSDDLSRNDVSTGIDSGRPATVIVSTRNQEIWRSADGGTTWARTTLENK